jgi:predicted MPP superfamily phosphohydrolase
VNFTFIQKPSRAATAPTPKPPCTTEGDEAAALIGGRSTTAATMASTATDGGTAVVLRVCLSRETRWGRVRWIAASWSVLFGLLGLLTGSSALMGLAAPPMVVGSLAKVLGWSWDRLVLPFIDGKPQLRKPALAAHATYWFGWFVAIIFDGGVTGSPPTPTGSSEPSAFTGFRYNWMGSLAIMAGGLWMLAIGDWLLMRAAPRLLAGPKAGELDDARWLWNDQPQKWKLTARRGVAVALLVVYVVLTVIAVGAGHDTPRLVKLTLPMAGLPACLSGYTVAMLSDVHGGPVVGRTDVASYVTQLNALRADVEVLVGDFADGPPAERADELAPLAELKAPDGIYYVTGNHEYLHGSTGNDWLRWMGTVGVTALNNTGLTLPPSAAVGAGKRWPACTASDTFDLLGIVDKTACRREPSLCDRGRVKIAVASAKAKLRAAEAAQLGTPARASLLLAHQPLDADAAAEAGLTAQVAGHTHGGQIWPIHWSTYLVNKGRVAGDFEVSRGDGDGFLRLYVGEGAVGWGPRLRLWAQTEITVLKLVPATEQAELTSDSSHSSQFGGLLASVLLIAAVGVFVITKLMIGYDLLQGAKRPKSPQTTMLEVQIAGAGDAHPQPLEDVP